MTERNQLATHVASLDVDVWIRPTRRLAAQFAVLFILTLGFTEGSWRGDLFASLALAALLLASVAAFVEAAAVRNESGWGAPLRNTAPSSSAAWFASVAFVAVGSIVAVQTWFRDGTSIAGGDIGPPDGVAWISRLFAPWSWSGFDLGSPSTLETQLPWALVAQMVHSAGGSAALAQRIWYTTLFTGAAVGALLLLRILGAHPVAAAIGAAVYVLNPYVVSTVGTSPVFLMALALAVLLPACVLGVGRSAISVRMGAILIGISSPFVGYAYANPPLAGMVVVALLVAPGLVWWLWGGQAARRASQSAILGLGLLVVLSAYWIVPAALQVHTSAIGRLSAASSWTWTEVRATVSNAFWLNTSWAWNAGYFPYADAYSRFPLTILKFALPAAAISSLWAVDRFKRDPNYDDRAMGLPLVSVVSVFTLLVLVVSTGTRPPGSWLFDPLYSLPLGWLLREPARFLLLAGLGYSVLVAALVTRLSRIRIHVAWLPDPRKVPLALCGAAVLGTALSLSVGFPLVTGAVVPDSRPGLPSMHVRLPNYWIDMAAFVDHAPYDGAVVLLPPDDFYQMPYKWGYYGTDGFIPYLVSRPVLAPNNQGYFGTSEDLVGAVNLTASSLLDSNWEEAGRLLQSLRAPLILVRGDIAPDFPGRSILAPAAISTALRQAPNFRLLHEAGPLELFASVQPQPPTIGTAPVYATVDSTSPDLRVLSLLPSGTSLISRPALPGVLRLTQIPPPSVWRLQSGSRQIQLDEPAGWRYEIGLLGPRGAARLINPQTEPKALSPYALTEAQNPDGSGRTVVIRSPVFELPTSNLILIGYPDNQVGPVTQLLVLHETYSSDWSGPPSAPHVLVDGTINGWLVQPSQSEWSAHYAPTGLVSAGSWTSLAGIIILIVIANLVRLKRLWPYLRGRLHA